MRKNLLTLSIAAMVGGLSGVAAHAGPVVFDSTATTNIAGNATTPAIVGQLPPGTSAASRMAFTADGIGHVLLVPYFTTNGDNKSLLNIVNTDLTNGKAVKLRYRNALNSDDIFDITVYLSPGDVWTADVAADAQGYSRLVTEDASCTAPSAAYIKEADNGRFATGRVLNNAPAGTREGYIEILNTADIRPFLNGVDGSPDFSKPNPLFTTIKHVNDKAPCSAALLENSAVLVADANSPNSPRNRGYSYPTGGLFADWTIVNVTDKASFSGNAAAVQANGAGKLVWFPQSSTSVTALEARAVTADPLLTQGRVQAALYDFPDLSTPYTTGAATPEQQSTELSTRMAVRSVSNEYLSSAGIAFATDWVFSMPTRRYQVAVDYATKTAVQAANLAPTNVGTKHFVIKNNPVAGNFLDGNVTFDVANQRLCVTGFDTKSFNREESSKTNTVISPAGVFNLCGEANVLTFNNPTFSLMGAPAAISQNVNTGFGDGWFTVSTPGYNNNGLPVLGFAAAKTRGANLGGTWAHRVTR